MHINIIVNAFIFYCRCFIIILIIVIMIAIIISSIISMFKTSVIIAICIYCSVKANQAEHNRNMACAVRTWCMNRHIYIPPAHNMGRKCLSKMHKCDLSAHTEVTSQYLKA